MLDVTLSPMNNKIIPQTKLLLNKIFFNLSYLPYPYMFVTIQGYNLNLSNIKSQPKSTILNRQDKNLVTCCGLYCGDCFFHKGEIAGLARDLRKKLRGAKLDQTYQEFAKFSEEFNNYRAKPTLSFPRHFLI